MGGDDQGLRMGGDDKGLQVTQCDNDSPSVIMSQIIVFHIQGSGTAANAFFRSNETELTDEIIHGHRVFVTSYITRSVKM